MRRIDFFKCRADETLVMKEICLSKINKLQQNSALNEVKILESLSFSYIVAYHNSFIENKKLYTTMEYCGGGDLFQLIKGRNGKLVPEGFIWKFV